METEYLPPVSYASPPHGAEDAQWQCQIGEGIGTNFWNLPTHCQRAMLANTGHLEDLLTSPSENNPINIATEDSPMPEMYSASDELMSWTLTSSTKKDKKDKKNKSGGDSDGCEWNDGSPGCVVESLPASDDFEGFSAEFSGQQQDKYEPLPEIPKLRELLIKRLDDKETKGRCRKFLESVLNNLGINKTMEKIFDEVAANGGFIVNENVLRDYGKQAVSRWGDKSPHPIGMQSLLKGDNEAASVLRVNYYITTLFHELIHRAGVGNHKKMAQAAFGTLSADEQKQKDNKVPKGNEAAEGYFNNMLNTNCRYDPYANQNKK